jgi:hypothetical protein
MKCRYCNMALAPLRSLTDGEFCCDVHRHAFHEEQAARNEVSLRPLPQGTLVAWKLEFPKGIPRAAAPPICRLEPREFKAIVARPPAGLLLPWRDPVESDPSLWDGLLALRFSVAPVDSDTGVNEELPTDLEFPGIIALPQCHLYPATIPVERTLGTERDAAWESKPVVGIEPDAIPEEGPPEAGHSYYEVANSWRWLRDAWKNAPSDLKVVAILLPVLLALALGPLMRKPKAKAHAGTLPAQHALPSLPSLPSLPKLPSLPAANVQHAVADRWNNLHETISNRAAVDLTDDFRAGLDAWDSRSNLTSSWSYDASGFVQPGPLAIFKPTSDMTDYRFQFLGEIDQKGLGCAFRAADLDNYYAVKLLVVKPGPLPLVRLVRYTVLKGKETGRVEIPLPIATRPDTLYRMVVDVRGSDFTVIAQGQVVDFWSDRRLPRGGVGFFCGRGEKARVRWVEVSHQYDALGRLCAYLAPYGFEGRNGNFN